MNCRQIFFAFFSLTLFSKACYGMDDNREWKLVFVETSSEQSERGTTGIVTYYVQQGNNKLVTLTATDYESSDYKIDLNNIWFSGPFSKNERSFSYHPHALDNKNRYSSSNHPYVASLSLSSSLFYGKSVQLPLNCTAHQLSGIDSNTVKQLYDLYLKSSALGLEFYSIEKKENYIECKTLDGSVTARLERNVANKTCTLSAHGRGINMRKTFSIQSTPAFSMNKENKLSTEIKRLIAHYCPYAKRPETLYIHSRNEKIRKLKSETASRQGFLATLTANKPALIIGAVGAALTIGNILYALSGKKNAPSPTAENATIAE